MKTYGLFLKNSTEIIIKKDFLNIDEAIVYYVKTKRLSTLLDIFDVKEIKLL